MVAVLLSETEDSNDQEVSENSVNAMTLVPPRKDSSREGRDQHDSYRKVSACE
jgi:hypothetical protein